MTNAQLTQHAPPSAKIALFRSLFKGREDLYPQRFESRKTGKAGYSPACGNEWVRGICEKPKIKCSECRHRCFLPVNDNVVKWHLLGHDDAGKDFVMGIYPMLLDETCYFLAADFDKSTWQEDVKGFLKTCKDLNIPAAIERSRSGRGAHVWLFFSEAIPAVLARKLGCHILTETMEHNPDIGLDSYDRFFPNQDTLPQGGFGNLIALPLQKKARDQGNSVFVCKAAKLAIELDGAQHLNSVDAYRRDRRKDLLLQENGYTVLRFLTEDLGKHLDEVLDTILRVLSSNQKIVNELILA